MQSVDRQNKTYYDTEARVYDENRYGSVAGQRVDAFHKSILDRYISDDLSGNSNILEVGCGTGRLLSFLAQRGFNISGVDISEGMLEVARNRLRENGLDNIELKQTSGDTLPFPDHSFDATYAILVINLVPDFGNLFQEIARVTKPGGILVFNVPNLYSIYWPGGFLVNSRKKTIGKNAAGFRYSHWFTMKEITAVLQAAGFDIEDVRGQHPLVRHVSGVSSLDGRGLGRLFSKSIYIKGRLKAQ